MSSSHPDRGSSRRRGYWMPIAVTLTVATVGVAAWLWSQHRQQQQQREENQGGEEEGQDLDYENADYGDNPAYGTSKDPDDSRDHTPDNNTTGSHGRPDASAQGGWGMSGALRRTPSPQQLLAGARKTVAAGMTAVGSALASIREDDNGAYADHETWSEEAEAKKKEKEKGQDRRAIAEATNFAAAMSTVSARGPDAGGGSSRRKKTVAIVVSADVDRLDEAFGEGSPIEHASILSHIPRDIDFSKTKLYILIYAPNLKESTPLEPTSARAPPSVSSSFSNIEHSQAQTPADEPKSPTLNTSPSTPHHVFAAMYQQAVALVEKERNVLPFTTPSAHVHILRHIKPEVVYLQESLAGDNGSVVLQLQKWLRHDVVLVVGAESGHGGLADSESEADTGSHPPPEKWWQREDRVGRGRGVVVVDGMRVSDDWAKRVQGKE